jgi:hypothetical protein
VVDESFVECCPGAAAFPELVVKGEAESNPELGVYLGLAQQVLGA